MMLDQEVQQKFGKIIYRLNNPIEKKLQDLTQKGGTKKNETQTIRTPSKVTGGGQINLD